ncbi:glycerol-3-phosphate dehydrogenase [Candidatus Igneacidithiobacillus taiwanensis]|uniref:glycerol-3-phosphate dehydrogenase n=1 Tax=Candidatus Igneacidithiobacillus taiwanensis TaxID=1945924 RepID=UPI0028A004F6|nr:glycerol-3-phosphate dehydrogenase [Candidatus Igneacidithiobacillus taiwanensis]
MAATYDILIVGGGINGVGIARDAAGRGLSVLLVEQDDLAAHTSSASTKLIHGGLRYLEYYEFRLVREALQERERLLGIAPHIIWPLEFLLPEGPGGRARWKIRAGLWLYDHLASRQSLPASRALDFATHPAHEILQEPYRLGFSYADCWVEDSRLVVLNALDAKERGAEIRTRCRLLSARPEPGHWRAQLQEPSGTTYTVTASVLVNATGPWVGDLLHRELGLASQKTVRKVKGSHIIVPKLYAGDFAFLLQNPDKRIVFAIPYESEYTLIGTTDIPMQGDPAKVEISPQETQYLCASVNAYFRKSITPQDVCRSYSGVRPLYDDHAANASAVTRDYVLDLQQDGHPPLLSVFGGKITTYRRLGEHALQLLAPALGLANISSWTASEALPGGALGGSFESFLVRLGQRYAFLPPALCRRLARAYGSRVESILGTAQSLADLGTDFGGGLYQAEVDYLWDQEWAREAEDILWRRSKLALHVPAETPARLEAYLQQRSRGGRESIGN